MSDTATIPGGLPQFQFTAGVQDYTVLSHQQFGNLFGNGGDSAFYVGGPTVPLASASANQSLVVTAAGSDTTMPPGYQALYDIAGSDTVSGGDNNMTVFLQGGLTPGTVFDAGSGNDGIWAGGADTISAGSGSTTIAGGLAGATVNGGTGDLAFYGGAGAVSVIAGQAGSATIFGSTSGTSYLAGGAGNNTLVGGSGAAPTVMFGGNNAIEFAAGTGDTTMISGTGTSQLAGQSGSGTEAFYLIGNTTTVALNNNSADSVFGGFGASSVQGGATNKDVFGFIAGHTGGTETIFDFTNADEFAFGGFGANPVASENVVNGSDVIVLNDGTTITVDGLDHTIFDGLE